MNLASRVLAYVGSILIGVSLFAGRAQAAPLTYDEALSGDLGNAFPASEFRLDIGDNTVAGSTFYRSSGDFDFDTFAIVIPVGTRLTDVVYSFQATLLPGTAVGASEYILDEGNADVTFPYLAAYDVILTGPTAVHPFDGGLPVGSGTFVVQHYSLGASGNGFDADYDWTFTVEPEAIPEPASFVLIGVGLAGAWVRRRRQAAGLIAARSSRH